MRLPAQPAGAADIDDLVALVQSAYRGDASRQGWTTEADVLEGQRLDRTLASELIDDPDGTVLLVRAPDGEALACVQLRSLGPDAQGRQVAYLGLFAVSPNAQGLGVGSELMAYAEDYVQTTWGSEQIRITVISLRTELISYYERRDYYRTGETEPFPYGDERFGVPQRADLEFAVLVKDLSAPGTAPGG